MNRTYSLKFWYLQEAGPTAQRNKSSGRSTWFCQYLKIRIEILYSFQDQLLGFHKDSRKYFTLMVSITERFPDPPGIWVENHYQSWAITEVREAPWSCAGVGRFDQKKPSYIRNHRWYTTMYTSTCTKKYGKYFGVPKMT